MPIYEYYCPDNHTIYQFFAKTMAQGRSVPRCPANSSFRMVKMISSFAVMGRGKPGSGQADAGDAAEDPKMEAAMGAMEREFSNVDENDPRSMGRMMRRMAELTGEKIEGEMEEVVRKLEEGADPDSLEGQMGGDKLMEGGTHGDGMGEQPPGDPKEPRHRFKARRPPARRDPQLYDYA